MVTSLWFSDDKDFNLFCKLQRLKKEDIIQIFYEKGRILLILDRDVSEIKKWRERKSQFMKELKGT